MSSIYEMTGDAMALVATLQDADLPEETKAEAISVFLDGTDEKLEAIGYVCKNLEALSDACKAEAERVAAKGTTARKAKERLYDAVGGLLDAAGVQTGERGYGAGLGYQTAA